MTPYEQLLSDIALTIAVILLCGIAIGAFIGVIKVMFFDE